MKKAVQKITCPDSLDGIRLDLFLAERLKTSRSYAKMLVEGGLVTVDGKLRSGDSRLKGGVVVSVSLGARDGEGPGLEGRILHEDRDLLVLDKPAGLLMHPMGTTWLSQPEAAAREPGPNLAGLLQRFRPGIVSAGTPRCGIVHRLDRQTSGVLLVAKNPAAYERLTQGFKDRLFSKVYKAIVAGVPVVSSASVDAPVGRPPGKRLVEVTPLGRQSVTRVRVASRCAVAALVEARPLTGRTHQIRAHLAHLGHPVIGDPEFPLPAGIPAPPRMMLHAWRIELDHPGTGRRVRYEAPAPRDFREFWVLLSRA